MIQVVWLNYNNDAINSGYWDQQILEDLFDGSLWPTGLEFRHTEMRTDFGADGVVVVIPGRHNAKYIDKVNEYIRPLKWCLVIITGDEERVFPVEKLSHPNMAVWLQTPNMNDNVVDRFIPNGYSKDYRQLSTVVNKDIDLFFAGQITHDRRVQMRDAVLSTKISTNLNVDLVESPRFTEGIEHTEYVKQMDRAKVVPIPGGAVIPDTFRLYEAMESGCVPIVDTFSPTVKEPGYYQKLFGEEPPFPLITDWVDLQGHANYHKDVYPKTNNTVQAWWINQKRKLVKDFERTVNKLQGVEKTGQGITVLIPTSPIATHPDTTMIDTVINSIVERLPDSEIIIMFDGVREEQKHYAQRYEEYKQRIIQKCNNGAKNVLPVVFTEHMHQAGMTRHVLNNFVDTDQILFVEHDAPLCEDIPFNELSQIIRNRDLNMIRLHHEALILDVHKHLMLDNEPIIMNGLPIVRTGQWSQRPHLASKGYYINLLNRYFSDNAKTMIEDVVHSPVGEAFRQRGKAGWNDFKVGIYAPQGDMKRSYHLDGRGGDSKFEETFIQ